MALPETPPHGSSQPTDEAAIFRGFFESASDSIVVLDEQLTIVRSNHAADGLFGPPMTPHIRVPFLDLVDAIDRSAVSTLLRDVLANGRGTHEIRAECQRWDGMGFPADLSVSLFSTDDKRYLGLVVRDRTLIERTQRRLRREQDLFRTLFTNAPVPLREENFSAVGDWFARLRARGVTDLDAYIDEHVDEFVGVIMSIKTVRVNPAFVRLMRADTEAELLAGFQSSEFSRGTLDSFRRQFLTFWNDGTYHEAEFIGYNRNGEPFECFVTVSVQRMGGHVDLGRVIAAFLDLTEIRSSQRSLERLVADKDQFIASVSHELRTPLASVLGLSDELHNHWDRFEIGEVRQLLGIISDQSQELSTLVEDLLVAAKAEMMGSMAVHPERVEVGDLVAEVVAESVTSGTLEGAIPIEGLAKAALADPVRVRQIVRNLITNAVRYGGDRIHIQLGRDDHAWIKVLDDGPGIPLEERDKIFDPYHRASGSDARLGALGLGLTISRQLARMMDGELAYNRDGAESVFTLTLPGAR